MPIFTNNDKKKLKKYISFVENSSNTSFMQDPSWTKVKKNWKSYYVYIEENKKIIIGMTILIQVIPKIKRSIMYCPRGPIGKINDISLIERLLREIKPLAQKYKAFMLKVDPGIIYNESIRKNFKKVGFLISSRHPKREKIIQPTYHMVLDINDKNENQILNSFAPKTRYNIRLAKRKGIKVKYSNTEENLRSFYKLFEETTKRDKFPCKPYEYFIELIKNFDKEHLRIYVAEYDNEPLASAITFKYGKEIFYLYGASSDNKRNFMPMYALQWKMIKWEIENRCETYNLGGLASQDNTTGLY
ncbi:MAG: lipid II:glycine glycyltransferase FemX [Clostridia bacterium]